MQNNQGVGVVRGVLGHSQFLILSEGLIFMLY
jgi:hypothetical protein